MFENTLDKKKEIVDNKGNKIIDLTSSIFATTAQGFSGFTTVKLTNTFEMRPDKVSFAEYGNIDSTEFILKYSGISNPFSLSEDDVLMIPNEQSARSLMADMEEDKKETKAEQIRNYYKFTNKDFKTDSTAYDNLANKKIESGVLDPTEGEDYLVPYISDNGTAAITIKNGKMYFGEDNYSALQTSAAGTSNLENISNLMQNYFGEDNYSALQTSAAGTSNLENISNLMQNKITSLLLNSLSNISDQCAINGMTTSDFIRASVKNAEEAKLNSLLIELLTQNTAYALNNYNANYQSNLDSEIDKNINEYSNK